MDLLFTCNTFHHLEERVAYFEGIKRYLRPGGRVAIIDYSGEGNFFEKRHSTPPEVVKREMEQAGYVLDEDAGGFLDRQSFLIFSPATGG